MTFVLFEIDDINGSKTTSGTLSDSQTASTGAVGYGKATVNPVGADKVSSTVRYVADALTFGKFNAGTVHAFCGHRQLGPRKRPPERNSDVHRRRTQQSAVHHQPHM